MDKTTTLTHPFEPVWDGGARVLVLGSFPSVLSRVNHFYYGNPRNRFWQVLGMVWGEELPEVIPGRTSWLLAHHIALWDVLKACTIRGSSDATIRGATANDLTHMITHSDIRHVFLNGQTAARHVAQQQALHAPIPFIVLPSTSPANAAWGVDRLADAWQIVRRAVEEGGTP